MRPLKRFEVLPDEEVDFIIDGAKSLLKNVGMHVDYPELLDIFGQAGARIEDERSRGGCSGSWPSWAVLRGRALRGPAHRGRRSGVALRGGRRGRAAREGSA